MLVGGGWPSGAWRFHQQEGFALPAITRCCRLRSSCAADVGLDEKSLTELTAGPFHVAGQPRAACCSGASKPQHRVWGVFLFQATMPAYPQQVKTGWNPEVFYLKNTTQHHISCKNRGLAFTAAISDCSPFVSSLQPPIPSARLLECREGSGKADGRVVTLTETTWFFSWSLDLGSCSYICGKS